MSNKLPAKLPPSQRHRARVVAFQVLYELELAPRHDVEAALAQRVREAPLPAEAARFAQELVAGVSSRRAEIDERIRAAAPAWPLDQMPKVDISILRLAIFEILFDNRTPLKAAINEAVELAKQYGGESSPRFVNGVLGAIAANAASAGQPPV
jgi:N utilization substance protein B